MVWQELLPALRRAMLPLAVVSLSSGVAAQSQQPPLPVEKATATTLPDHRGQGWVWLGGSHAPSQIDGRFMLFDAQAKHLGQLNNGFWPNNLLVSARHDEVYAAETYFARGLRGARTDVVTAYDGKNLSALYEIEIPAKRIGALASNTEVLSDDERFMLVLNYTPAQSVSIVDLEHKRFVSEVETPGCANLYTAGPRDFYAICGNGGFLHLRLDDEGKTVLKQRTAPLFDAVGDALNAEASRQGDTWYFTSQHSEVYALRMNADGIERVAQWPLLDAADRDAGWRVSGRQNTALHLPSGEFYVLMGKNTQSTRQDPGDEVWVYDLKSHKRLRRLPLGQPALSCTVNQVQQPRLFCIDYMVPLSPQAQQAVVKSDGMTALYKVIKQGLSVYDAASGKLQGQSGGLPSGSLTSLTVW